MPEVENFQDAAEHYFEVARKSNFLEEDAAIAAFDLLTANTHDCISAHALGVSL